MMIAVALATLAVAPPGPDPGRGTRVWTELGVTRYSAGYAANRGDAIGSTGIDGFGGRIHSVLAFGVAHGFFLGPAVGVGLAATDTSGGICCGTIGHVLAPHVGVEAAYYPSVKIGFRISGGFGLAAQSLGGDGPSHGPLAGVSAYGSYWTLALARDYHVGRGTRIGGVLRVEAEALSGQSGDHRYHFQSFTPSLSLVVLSHLGSGR